MSNLNHQDNFCSVENINKRHEGSLKFLTTQANILDETILDLQVSLGKYHSSNGAGTSETGTSCTEEETRENILKIENSAAGLLCWLNSHHATQGLDLGFTKDVLGIVATLARVEDDNLSRLMSEYLGMETMLAIVCRTYEGVKALEKYDEEGNIKSDSKTCLHGAESSVGKKINGRFLVICLEDLRQYAGDFVADDPQKKLDIQKPKLPNGNCPDGFIDYAVNLVNLESRNLSFVTTNGQGLRETLFYCLLSRLQIYKTRAEMLQAFSCITDGALSLDGGMIKKSGAFALGSRKDVEVKFPLASGKTDVPAEYFECEDRLRKMKWERANIAADMRRVQELMNYTKANCIGQE
ncbi:protein DEFECTIVE IN MERISTEM SILENCING 3-like isoform X2 [Humulus lupulus]|uniref:protein DEFECTIVE IN MERISTEM SILENCING 3-like isoform X2 n=1 Tax=Humulus lupulus TaxID=3486 RepID=UPI002B41215E|nr:protein DEFECTIVE IN MERISTEM SILENCING 3-like isoform X2 [Humulus lupulus]